MAYEFDVFLSHNSRDKGDVVKLKALLVARKLRCWLDKDELPPGGNWITLLQKGLENSLAIAACVGRSGLGPWHDEEIQAALQIAVSQGRPVIPVLLPDAGREPELPLFLRNRVWVDFRSGFADDALDAFYWGVSGSRPGGAHAEDGPQSADNSGLERSGPDEEVRLRGVFGKQFDNIKKILTDNLPLRDLLLEKLGVTTQDAEAATRQLIARFHSQFLPAVGAFGKLYRTSSHRAELVELASSVMYLGMAPAYAEQVRRQYPNLAGSSIPIHPEARNGISQLLICWAQGDAALPPQAMSQERSQGFFESTPQMSVNEIRLSLLDRFGINPNHPDADAQLESMIRMKNNFGEPPHLTVEESSILDDLRRPGSPLRELLVFIKDRAASIHPARGASYDRDVEVHFDQLKVIFGTK